MAIEIAFPLREKVRDDGLEVSRQSERLEIGKHPSTHVPEDPRCGPLPFAGTKNVIVRGNVRGIQLVEERRVLWKDGGWKGHRICWRNDRSLSALKKAVQRNIETERLSRDGRERLFHVGHESNLSLDRVWASDLGLVRSPLQSSMLFGKALRCRVYPYHDFS